MQSTGDGGDELLAARSIPAAPSAAGTVVPFDDGLFALGGSKKDGNGSVAVEMTRMDGEPKFVKIHDPSSPLSDVDLLEFDDGRIYAGTGAMGQDGAVSPPAGLLSRCAACLSGPSPVRQHNGFHSLVEVPSLSESHATVPVPADSPWWRKMLSFVGMPPLSRSPFVSLLFLMGNADNAQVPASWWLSATSIPCVALLDLPTGSSAACAFAGQLAD